MPCGAGQTGKIEITLLTGEAAFNTIWEIVPLHPGAQPTATDTDRLLLSVSLVIWMPVAAMGSCMAQRRRWWVGEGWVVARSMGPMVRWRGHSSLGWGVGPESSRRGVVKYACASTLSTSCAPLTPWSYPGRSTSRTPTSAPGRTATATPTTAPITGATPSPTAETSAPPSTTSARPSRSRVASSSSTATTSSPSPGSCTPATA